MYRFAARRSHPTAALEVDPRDLQIATRSRRIAPTTCHPDMATNPHARTTVTRKPRAPNRVSLRAMNYGGLEIASPHKSKQHFPAEHHNDTILRPRENPETSHLRNAVDIRVDSPVDFRVLTWTEYTSIIVLSHEWAGDDGHGRGRKQERRTMAGRHPSDRLRHGRPADTRTHAPTHPRQGGQDWTLIGVG